MDTLLSMRIFRQVVELNSFIGASEKLDISTAMTSKHIKHLEEYLGVRLLNRTSRRLSLTDEGRVYYDSCAEILNELEEAESALKCSSVIPRGGLKVAVPAWFHFKKFTDGINKYCEKYPEVLIELLLNDRLVDLVEEGIDVALRVTPEPHSNLIARRITEVKFFIAGSTEYLNKNGRPKNISELQKHKFINTNNLKQKNQISYLEDNESKHVDITPVLLTNNTTMIARAATSNIGLAFLPEYLINEEALVNRLEPVLPELILPTHYLFAVYSSRRFLSPKVRTFIDFMVDWFKNK